jgi:hypothetical protein
MSGTCSWRAGEMSLSIYTDRLEEAEESVLKNRANAS